MGDWVILFGKNLFSKPNLLCSKVHDCHFWGVQVRLSTRSKICFTFGLFANYFFSKITQLLSQMSYGSALKLTGLWITSLLFDLNNEFINRSLAFSPG